MRLTKIKLVGFKSFVDPTILHLPSNLVGIVGPNGCGKSNVIDAVRWVMGESAVRQLRGESMADVIFSGSATRKPVGQASIELVFDNSVSSLSGPWLQYNEIAVKRLLTRGGQSSYFLNGTRCRRRDITDLFLGTGLGPRSYAIIEQGMIARLVEAKPEELRVFFEEAAGISKYKERRRETETRMRHTRENLERLDDVVQELDKQLAHLQRQADNAERYKRLKAEERRLKAELLLLYWRDLEAQVVTREQEIRELQTLVEATLAEQRALEARLEAGREQQGNLRAALDRVQKRYYEAGAEINRLEQDLAHIRQLRRRQRDELERLAQNLQQTDEQIGLDQERLAQLQQALSEAEPALESARMLEAEAGQALAQTQAAMENWQTHWDVYNQRFGEARRQAEVERTRIEQLERQLTQHRRRLQDLLGEQQNLDPAASEQELETLQSEEQAIGVTLAQQQEKLEQTEGEIIRLRASQKDLTAQLHRVRERIQTARGRLSSLQTLQQASLGRRQAGTKDWLRAQGLEDAPRLAETLVIEPGWERAVEVVLGDYLEGVWVQDLEAPVADLAALKQGYLTLLDRQSRDSGKIAGSLAAKIQGLAADDLLAGVYTADNVAEALARRQELEVEGSLITRDGIWLGWNWLRVVRDNNPLSGVLVREREIRALEEELEQDEQILEEHSAALESKVAELKTVEADRHTLQDAINQSHRRQAGVQGRLHSLEQRLQQIMARREVIVREQQALELQTAETESELRQARERLQHALQSMAQTAAQGETLKQDREQLKTDLEQCRSQAVQCARVLQRQSLEVESLRNGCSATQQALQRLEVQQAQLNARYRQLSQDVVTDDEPTLQVQLELHLQTRMQIEEELRQARQALEEQETLLRTLEQNRLACADQLQEQRQVLEARRLSCSEVRIHRQTRLDQLQELGAEPTAVAAELPTDASEQAWLDRLERLVKRIKRLGAINLAAIEEFAQLSERKHYLDSQHADLVEALSTLENAMAKIDRETRSRFKDTFNKVDAGLQALFPRLFGGGQAHLELTGDDTLNSGVAIMARPPGKRIGSIHLLSGGEKALTAVALVFAIFQLNPAPFCLLDEVDAPLDDANVGRFGALVREMSEQVQFIFITHNKGTMEIAHHLSGVTMHEPGVSRLVSVDVEEAVRLVAV